MPSSAMRCLSSLTSFLKEYRTTDLCVCCFPIAKAAYLAPLSIHFFSWKSIHKLPAPVKVKIDRPGAADLTANAKEATSLLFLSGLEGEVGQSVHPWN